MRRTPKNYEGTGVTSHQVSSLLSDVLLKIGEAYQEQPELILAAWPQVIGPKLASMTRAESFSNGILQVKVKNSTLYSLLTQYEKGKILSTLRQMFPKAEIKNVLFRIG